jgi:hypothetical protein
VVSVDITDISVGVQGNKETLRRPELGTLEDFARSLGSNVGIPFH